MATSAVARDTVFVLRQKIAKIEGRLAERLDAPVADGDADDVVVRRHGRALPQTPFLRTGVGHLDEAMGGGLPGSGLSEIHGAETRDAGAVAGFVLALVAILRNVFPPRPVLWIGTADIFGEAGYPYALGLSSGFGLKADDLLFAEAARLTDALWIAEEAAGLKALAAVILEVRGNPAPLNLNATRRLHVRAQRSGRPLFLLRQAAFPDPTAAPVRLVVSPASAGLRSTIAGPLPRSIGPPAFTVALSKSRFAKPGQVTLEWNADERVFHDRNGDSHADHGPGRFRPEDHGAVLSLSRA